MTSNLFHGSITIKVKGSHRKFTWSHEFTPHELRFQETLTPIFLQDVSIPERERMFLTKDIRKLMLQMRNLRSASYANINNEIKNFIKEHSGKKLSIEAHGIGVYIVSQTLKTSSEEFVFNFHEFPFALLEKSFKRKIIKNKNYQFYYSENTPFKPLATLLGPKYKWTKVIKSLVA